MTIEHGATAAQRTAQPLGRQLFLDTVFRLVHRESSRQQAPRHAREAGQHGRLLDGAVRSTDVGARRVHIMPYCHSYLCMPQAIAER